MKHRGCFKCPFKFTSPLENNSVPPDRSNIAERAWRDIAATQNPNIICWITHRVKNTKGTRIREMIKYCWLVCGFLLKSQHGKNPFLQVNCATALMHLSLKATSIWQQWWSTDSTAEVNLCPFPIKTVPTSLCQCSHVQRPGQVWLFRCA